jgi:hypothetical protein
MDESNLRALLHQVANLLGVVQIQAAAARATGTLAAAHQALAAIEDCATRTAGLLAGVRHQ